jgi:hypothetical protein
MVTGFNTLMVCLVVGLFLVFGVLIASHLWLFFKKVGKLILTALEYLHQESLIF